MIPIYLQVIVIPKLPGTYVAQLSIHSYLFIKDKESDVMTTEVTIRATAETPQIQVN